MSDTPDRFGCPPKFDAFYEALNRRPPFPWQSRLASQVTEDGVWPKEIGVPTGLGKTACLEIALWWLACQAERKPSDRTAPTRIWWVVNRRMLVDSTFDHAERIRQKLLDPAAAGPEESVAVVRAVAERLRSLSPDPATAGPLEVIRLRGGVAARRPTDPSRPCIILSTVPMYGSRLLFRGYGTWRSMRPIDAALAGMDSLVFVDEAHLARHLMRLVPALSDCTKGSEAILGPERSRPRVVALTATGEADARDRFDLDGDDKAHATVQQRLDAPKPVQIVESSGGVGLHLAEATQNLVAGSSGRGASCIVFANTPRTARAVFRRLESMFPDGSADLVLLTGRSREWEAEQTRRRILDPVHGMAAERDHAVGRDRHLIVVATQTLEVGADVDAEYLVTEACGVRALTQRLGRLNRMGGFPDARGIYVHVPPPQRRGGRAGDPDTWPVYGQEPSMVLDRLLAAAGANGKTVPLPPRSVASTLGEPADDPGRAPEVMHGILYEWVKTTNPPDGEAPVEPYFSGVSGFDYSVSLIWRAHVPSEGDRLWPRASDREAVSVPVGEARLALGDDAEVRRLAADGVSIESAMARDMRPGDVVVLASDRGLLDEFGWEPEAAVPVLDLSLGEHGLPLNAETLHRLFNGVNLDPPSSGSLDKLVNRILGLVADSEELDATDSAEAVAELLGILQTAVPVGWEEPEWLDFLSSLNREVAGGYKEVSRLPVRQRVDPGTSDDLDERSLADAATAMELAAHGNAVAARSRSIAERMGLASELADVVETAGRLHDLGKADPRFQRWLDPRQEWEVPLAKSGMKRHLWSQTRLASGWPQRGRHEALSSRLVVEWLRRSETRLCATEADLLVHLVVSHHGSGRPIVGPVSDGTRDTVSVDVLGERVEAAADLATVDWDQPARFRRLNDEFGPWGLALIETIVRQADHAVSAGAHVGELENGE